MSLQSTDAVADLITRIRNAVMVGKNEIRVPSSKLKKAVADGLKKAKYVEAVEIEESKPQDTLRVVINKPGENSNITEISKVSTPGRRVYVGANKIPRVQSGRGMVLVSTSKGVISGNEAKKLKLGGEVLVKVW